MVMPNGRRETIARAPPGAVRTIGGPRDAFACGGGAALAHVAGANAIATATGRPRRRELRLNEISADCADQAPIQGRPRSPRNRRAGAVTSVPGSCPTSGFMTLHRDMKDMIEPSDKHEPIDNSDPADAIEPTERTDPTDPTDSTEPLEAMESSESSDHRDHLELSRVSLTRWNATACLVATARQDQATLNPLARPVRLDPYGRDSPGGTLRS